MAKDKVIATVNGERITKQDLDNLIGGLDPQYAAQFKSEEGQKNLLAELINRKLFLMDALENKLENENEFEERLRKVRDDILVHYSISRLFKDLSISIGEAENFYKENQTMFKKPEQIKASHILLKEEEAANSVLKEINDGMSFEEAANKYSMCDEKDGGDLGYFPRGKMVQEFEDVAFSMKSGDISHPVKTQFGYHIIKVYDKKEGNCVSFDDVKQQIQQQLASMKQREVYENKVAEFKEKYKVIVLA